MSRASICAAVRFSGRSFRKPLAAKVDSVAIETSHEIRSNGNRIFIIDRLEYKRKFKVISYTGITGDSFAILDFTCRVFRLGVHPRHDKYSATSLWDKVPAELAYGTYRGLRLLLRDAPGCALLFRTGRATTQDGWHKCTVPVHHPLDISRFVGSVPLLQKFPRLMATYVDEAAIPYKGKVRHHLSADSIAELHAFAANISIAKCWFHKGARHPHYDITSAERSAALEAGALAVTSKELIRATAHVKKAQQ